MTIVGEGLGTWGAPRLMTMWLSYLGAHLACCPRAPRGHLSQIVAKPRREELDMNGIIRRRGLAAMAVSIAALIVVAAGASSASASAAPVTRTFSFIKAPNSKTQTVVNIDSLLINARCSPSGAPVM